MDEQSNQILMSPSYGEGDMLDQPFILPDTSVMGYASSRQEDDCRDPRVRRSETYQDTAFTMYPDQRYTLDTPVEQTTYWESCASLEDVETAVYSSGCLTPPVIEIHRLDTGDRIGPLSDISGSGEQIVSSTENHKKKSGRKGKKKSAYKHVPHREKPAHLVAKRNARERRRVEAVNSAFVKLRKSVPIENKRGKRVSKVKVLQRAIDYILSMREAIRVHDGVPQQVQYPLPDDDHLFAF